MNLRRNLYESDSKRADGTARVKFVSPFAQDAKKTYSSIHLVCHANSYFGHSIKMIPIEVQTAFEDVWAELEHQRRYKAKEVLEAHHGNSLASTFSNSISRFSILKELLDNCSSSADLIKIDFHALSTTAIVLLKSTNNRLSNLVQYSAFAPNEIKESADTLEKQLTEFYDTILEKFGTLFDKMEQLIIAAENKYIEKARDKFAKDRQFDYFIKALAIKQSVNFSTTDFDESISSSLRLYFEMSDKNIYRFDSVLEYRIAACLLLWDQFDLALQKYKKANAVLGDDQTLPDDNVYRAIIPRQYWFVLYQKYDNICEKVLDIQKSALRQQASEIQAEAYKSTKYAYDTIKFKHDAEEEIAYVNNLLYYRKA